MTAPVVVDLAGAVVAADTPVLAVDDPLLSRGDGVFETLLVRDRRARLLDAHLARLGASAATAGLPPPDATAWRAAVATALTGWTDAEGMLRLLYGRRGGDAVAGFVTLSAVPQRVGAARRDGVAAVTVDRGLPARDAPVPPWSLSSVKSVSYALFTAAQRYAAACGAADAVLVSSDGFVLEGARASVVISPEPGVLLTPPPAAPVLPGTTVDALYDAASRAGWRCEHGWLTVADLRAAQGVWLLSSVTLAARVHTLDGVGLAAAPQDADVSALVAAAIG